MSTSKGQKYKNYFEHTKSILNFKEVVDFFNYGANGLVFDLSEYNYRSSYHALTKKKAKELFGLQDITVQFSYRNWVWVFEDGILFDGIAEDILMFLMCNERGVYFEVARKNSSERISRNDSCVGAACARFLENLAKFLKEKDVHI